MSGTIAYLIVVGALVALAARAGEELLRLAQRPVRWAWSGGLALLLVLTIRAVALGPSPLVPPAVGPLPAATQALELPLDAEARSLLHASVERARDAIAGIPRLVAARIAAVLPEPAAPGMAIAWAAMSIAVIALLALVYLRFSRTVRSLPTVMLHGLRVRVSSDAGPAVVGMTDPQVVVPAWLLDASDEEQRLAIAHEREHIVARDPLLLIAACVAAAALPWHPAAWWMLSRLRLAVEMDCDRRVLAAGTSRRLYGTTLIDIAARGGRQPFGAPALAEHTTHLERRLIAMAPAVTPYRRTRLLVVGASALLTIAAACEARLPSAPEIEAMNVATVENHVLAKTMLPGDSTLAYYVDGTRVTADASRLLAPEEIASIAVTVGATGNEVRITTKAAGPGDRSMPKVPGGSVTGAQPVDVVTMRPLASADHAGLVLIDGKPADMPALKRLTADRVRSMEVIKGDRARRLYDDPRAANGVIRVTTKP